jgi:hypothetical protein
LDFLDFLDLVFLDFLDFLDLVFLDFFDLDFFDLDFFDLDFFDLDFFDLDFLDFFVLPPFLKDNDNASHNLPLHVLTGAVSDTGSVDAGSGVIDVDLPVFQSSSALRYCMVSALDAVDGLLVIEGGPSLDASRRAVVRIGFEEEEVDISVSADIIYNIKI